MQYWNENSDCTDLTFNWEKLVLQLLWRWGPVLIRSHFHLAVFYIEHKKRKNKVFPETYTTLGGTDIRFSRHGYRYCETMATGLVHHVGGVSV